MKKKKKPSHHLVFYHTFPMCSRQRLLRYSSHGSSIGTLFIGLLSSRMATAYSLGRKGGYNIYTGVVYSILRITTNHLLMIYQKECPSLVNCMQFMHSRSEPGNHTASLAAVSFAYFCSWKCGSNPSLSSNKCATCHQVSFLSLPLSHFQLSTWQ